MLGVGACVGFSVFVCVIMDVRMFEFVSETLQFRRQGSDACGTGFMRTNVFFFVSLCPSVKCQQDQLVNKTNYSGD